MCKKKKRTSLKLKKCGSRFLVGLLAMTMASTMIPSLRGMAQSVDASVVAQEDYSCYLDENFSQNNGWSVSGDTVSLIDTSNGILKLGSSGKAKYGTSTLSYDGKTYYSMKFRFPKTDTAKANRFALHLRNGVYRYYTNIEVGENKIRIPDRNTGAAKWYDCTIENNVWYEILFAFKGNEEGESDNFAAADIYLRTVDGNGLWNQLQTTAEDGIHRLFPTTDSVAASVTLEGYTTNTLLVEIDDVRFFKGDYRKLTQPKLENGQFVTDGEYAYADAGSEASRKATLLAAVYDKRYGYTTKVWQKDYSSIEPGMVQRLDNNFDASGIVAEDTDIAVMLWESVESGVPLTDAVGTMPQSTVGSNPAETLSYKISYNDVLVYGYAGASNDDVTISISDANGVQAITQTKSDSNGMIQVKLGINPYTCTGESYTLRVQCGTNVAQSYSGLKLLTQAQLPQSGFENVEVLKSFVEVYGNDTAKKCMAEGHGENVLQYLEELHAENGVLYHDIFAFLSALEEATALFVGTVEETIEASVVAQEEYACYLDDDFSMAKDWQVSGDTVSLIDTTNGVLKLGSAGKAKYGTADFSYDGDTCFSMKFYFPKTDSAKANRFALHLRNGVYRYYTNVEVGDDKIRIQDRNTGAAKWYDCTIKNNVWYEILFAFKGNEEGNSDNFSAADIYLRTVDGNGSWKQLRTTAEDGIHRLFPTTDSVAASITLEGYSTNTLLVEFDDIRCYKGNYSEMDEPKLEGNNLIVGGKYVYGNPSSGKIRRATVLAAAYDKKYGYTTRVWEKDYAKIKPGAVQDLSNTFEANGISENNEEFAVMLWESVESGVPLTESKGVVIKNMATQDDVSTEPLSYQVAYNEVMVSGYTGSANDDVTVSLESASGVKAITQTKSDGNGMVKVKLGINPYTCVEDVYTLRVQSGTTIAQVYSGIKLLTKSQIPSNGFADLNSFLLFVQTYCDGVQDEWMTLGLENEVFQKFNQLISNDYHDFYLFRNAINEAGEEVITDFNLLKEVNGAGSNWKKLEQLLLVDYREHLGLSENVVDHLDVKSLFTKVCGEYQSVDELMTAFWAAKQEEENKKNYNNGLNGTTGTIGGAGGFGGGGTAGASGGGAGYGGGVSVQKEALPESDGEVQEVVAKDGFSDLESVQWAKESILALQAEGIIAGDGHGLFYPDRPVTREEFLKLAMLAAGISVKTDNDVPFDDVEPDAWYHSYVAAAYQMGIVNGISETEFGIGKQITRGDMAVILERTLGSCNIVPKPTKAAFVFDDYYNIPSYAAKSVALLCEADLMHGVGDNLFMADASATRAEAAVAICNIYRYVEERR